MLQQFDERNRDLLVSVNGVLRHRDEGALSAFDSVVQGGDAVWEGLRLYDRRIFRLREHLERLRQSALALAFREIPSAEAIVAETNATHLFFVDRGVVRTPTTAACPEGITRAVVLEICAAHGIPHEVTDLSLTEAYRADEAFCTGTMGELAAVTAIDGRTIGDGRVGPMTQRLTALFRERTAREGEVVV